MFKKILIALVVVAAVVLILASRQPDTFSISRSATIDAAPAKVYAQVVDFHKWATWSPWDHMDPAMKKSYEGAASGKGAIYSWVGNSKVGEGKMTIADVKANQQVSITLEFIKPFQAVNDTTFDIKAEGKGTNVTWTMAGKNNMMSKVMCLFMSMDKMIGGDFEKGLAGIKAEAEKK